MWATDKQIGFIHVLSKKLGRKPACDPSRLTIEDASKMIKQLIQERKSNAVMSIRQSGISARADRLERFLHRTL